MALYRAIERGDLASFRGILDSAPAAADRLLRNRVSSFGPYAGFTPLMMACALGHTEVVREIFSRNLDYANVRLSNGLTPIMIACETGNVPILTLLTSAIDDRNIINSQRTSDGATALIIACKQENPVARVIETLGANSLGNGLNPDIPDRLGNTALMYLCDGSNRRDVIRLLLEMRASVNTRNRMDMTPLMKACMRPNNRSTVEELLEAGAAVNAVRKPDGATALLLAINNKNNEAASTLIRKGANINLGTAHTGYTPLMIACEKGSLDLIKKLVDNGANVNAARRDNGSTALIYASSRPSGATEIVHYLLKQNANVNAVTSDVRSTALMWASFKGNEGAVSHLLSYKANPHLKTTSGKTALTFATLGRHSRIIKTLTKLQKNTKLTRNATGKYKNKEKATRRKSSSTDLLDLLLRTKITGR